MNCFYKRSQTLSEDIKPKIYQKRGTFRKNHLLTCTFKLITVTYIFITVTKFKLGLIPLSWSTSTIFRNLVVLIWDFEIRSGIFIFFRKIFFIHVKELIE